MQEEGCICDWKSHGISVSQPVEFYDGTLHDGLQSPSVRTAHIEEKLQILHLMESLGTEVADIGLPGAGAPLISEVMRLAWEIAALQARKGS